MGRNLSPDSEWVARQQALRENLPSNFDKEDIQKRMDEVSTASACVIPYSGKFSHVKNFVESPLRAPEEIFAVLIFVALVSTRR